MNSKDKRKVFDAMMSTISVIRDELKKDRLKYQKDADKLMLEKDHYAAMKMAWKVEALIEFIDALEDADDELFESVLKNMTEGR